MVEIGKSSFIEIPVMFIGGQACHSKYYATQQTGIYGEYPMDNNVHLGYGILNETKAEVNKQVSAVRM